MKAVYIVVVACFVIAAAQAVATALAMLLLVALIYGLFAHPRQTFGLVGLLTFAGLAERQPHLLLGLAALPIVSAWMFRKS